MTDKSVLPDSSWHLLAEFGLKTEPISFQRAAALVEETLRPLNIQAAMLERIQKAVIEALRAMLEAEKALEENSPVRVQIVASGLLRVSEGQENDPQQSNNWGFFLLEKQRNSSETPYHRLDLFVYRETE
jgi:hypothetical protein